MVEIVPGILEKDWSEIERRLEIIKSFAKTVHVDIIDEKFAPSVTFLDSQPFTKYSQDLLLELHMMVDNPIQYLDSFAKAGFKRFIGHIEKMSDPTGFIAKAQLLGEVGLAIDVDTPLSRIEASCEDLDCVLFMAVKAGRSGQEFNQNVLKKIEDLRQIQGKFLAVELDGGINNKTIELARTAGADRVVVNSFLFNAENPQEQYNLLNE